jgi:Ankyrin repeats (3 copies)
MDLKPLPFDSNLRGYEEQAEKVLAAVRSGNPEAVKLFNHRHPRFLDSKIPWLPKNVSDAEIQNAPLDLTDAQLAIARWYDFRDWLALMEYVEAVTRDDSPVCRFESAVEAVVTGDLTTLKTLLREHPELVRARSTRITHFDPPKHGATLLHYVAANGVEGYRQRTPKNAVDVAKTLLQTGAVVDAVAEMYGGQCTTMSLLVSSCHPANAGVQVDLVETLIDFGAGLEGAGAGRWVSPLMTALVFGYLDAANALVKRGAKVKDLALAAGLGRLDEARRFLLNADGESRHRALALAAQLGHLEIVRLLLDAGENPDRYNPDGLHSHATPLHHAALHGHGAVVRLLVERGARLDIKDTIYRSTPLGWAKHAEQREVANLLRSKLAA